MEVAVAGGSAFNVSVGTGVDVGVADDVPVGEGDGVVVGVGVSVGVGVKVGVDVGVEVGSNTMISTRVSIITGSFSLVKGLSGPKTNNLIVAGPPGSSLVSQRASKSLSTIWLRIS